MINLLSNFWKSAFHFAILQPGVTEHAIHCIFFFCGSDVKSRHKQSPVNLFELIILSIIPSMTQVRNDNIDITIRNNALDNIIQAPAVCFQFSCWAVKALLELWCLSACVQADESVSVTHWSVCCLAAWNAISPFPPSPFYLLSCGQKVLGLLFLSVFTSPPQWYLASHEQKATACGHFNVLPFL